MKTSFSNCYINRGFFSVFLLFHTLLFPFPTTLPTLPWMQLRHRRVFTDSGALSWQSTGNADETKTTIHPVPLESGCKWVNSHRLLWSVFTSICNVCVFWRQIIRSAVRNRAPWDLCPIFRSESEVLGSSSTFTVYGCSMLINFAVIVLADNLEDVQMCWATERLYIQQLLGHGNPCNETPGTQTVGEVHCTLYVLCNVMHSATSWWSS